MSIERTGSTMPHLMKTIIFIVFFVLALVPRICSKENSIANNDNSSITPPENFRQIIDDIYRSKYKFCIMGEIVDPDGKIIPDVKILSCKAAGPMTSSFGKQEYSIRNGIFSFTSEGVFSWGLTFEKNGFYKTVVPMGAAHVANALRQGDKSYSLKGGVITRKTKIVLYPYGKFNDDLLEVDNKILTFSDHESNKSITCVIIPYRDGKRRRKDHEFEYAFSDEKKLPGNLIYIVPGYNQNGAHDGTIRLKVSGMDSGFLPVKYDGPHCFRSMWEAPEKGDYQPELVIEDGLTNYLQHNYVKPEAVGNMHPVGAVKLVPKTVPYTVFYFRVNGYYGKGLIMLGNAAGGDSFLKETRASLRVYLYVNRNPGIRNTNVWIGTNW